MSKKYIVANWKMNFDSKQVDVWIKKFKDLVSAGREDLEVILAPSFLHMEIAKKAGFSLAAQDVSLYDGGAHTGETGAFQIKEYCKYCIIGHSERNESIADILKKRDQCFKNNLTPIVCFRNLEDGVKFYTQGVILVWEDPNTISKDETYRAKDVNEIKKDFSKIRSLLLREAIVIYGGSVNTDNIFGLAKISGLNGVLVGHASLDPVHFHNLCSLI